MKRIAKVTVKDGLTVGNLHVKTYPWTPRSSRDNTSAACTTEKEECVDHIL